ncbi:MAG: YcbK family protein, partial [Beijerinckiaceae bacterium]
PSPAVLPPEIDEDADLLVDHDTPKRVTVLLPPPRPGATAVAAAEVAPVGQARLASAGELPPGVSLAGLPSAGQSQSVPSAPRLAALPGGSSTPRWTLTDEAPLRPPGARESERPVSNMPGVWAPPEATFQCLPDGLKQVLMDTAKRFGHVAVLNAQRGYGTGARGSYHYRCRAVDFRVRGVPVSTVYSFLRAHPNVGGRKIYPMGFFHVDDGPVRSW